MQCDLRSNLFRELIVIYQLGKLKLRIWKCLQKFESWSSKFKQIDLISLDNGLHKK